MAYVALTSLMATIELQFLQPIPRLSLLHEDQEPIKSFFQNLSSLREFLELFHFRSAPRDLEIEIRDFALEAEDNIEIQLSNFLLLPKHSTVDHQEETSQQLCLTLREAAKNAEELLNITNIEKARETERKMFCDALTSLIGKIRHDFATLKEIRLLQIPALIDSLIENLSSLREFIEISNFHGAAIKALATKITDFAFKAKQDIQDNHKLLQTLQEVAENTGDVLNIINNTAHFLLLSKEEAYQQLYRTLREAAENAAELLNIINIEKDRETERKMTCDALKSLIEEIEFDFEYCPLGALYVAKSVIQNLSALREFIEKSNFHDAAIKDLATKIRDFAIKATKDIDKQSREILYPRHTDNHEKASQKFHQTMQEVAENTIELVYSIINNTTKEADEANQTQPPIPWLKHAASQSANVMADGSKFEDRMIGHQNDVTIIKDQLFTGYSGLKVIPIIGMLGIGKTTLARRIFEDELVSEHFEVKIWFTMHQNYDEIQILRDLLRAITLAEQHEIKEGRTLTKMVWECLRYRRYLIVLDDIWSTRHWNYIKDCFPRYGKGSCILLTTRFYEVADYVCSIKGNHHVMSLLDLNESWDLFCDIFPLQKYRAPRFESFRSHLFNAVEKCDGLPQTIVIFAERLSKCNSNIQHELKKIEKEIELLGILDYSAITLIYNQLPEHLKVCFLYLGVFPKRSEIQVKTLLRLWVAEGFVKPSKNEELEKIAYYYLKDLIDRSLVLISHRNFDGKIKTCRVHSVMHNICFREAQKEGMLCAVNTQQLSKWSLNAFANSCRWFSLCKHSFDYYVLFRLNNPRSIFFFQDNSEIFVPLKLLRILAFVPSQFLQRVPMHLGDLVFLRYLSITQWFEGLNTVLSSNLNLQTLVVSGGDSSESQLGVPTLHLPSTIWESPQLKHLELGALYTADPPSVVKKKLQTLSWVGPTHCRKEVYSNFPNIKKLKIFFKEDVEPCHIGGSSSGKHIILDNLDYLARLESLTISALVGCIVTFPEQCVFPSQLKKLRLSGTNLSGWHLTAIGTLKHLEVLKLENVFDKEVWRVAEGGFYGLKFLLIEAKKLKRLEAYTDTFPFLKHLVLRCCHDLEEIPNSFGENLFLESIELDRCSCPSIVAFGKDIQEKRKKNYGIANFEIKIQGQGPEYDEKSNSEIKIQEGEYDESGHIVECVEDVGVGKFEKANFEIKIEEAEYDESAAEEMVECVEEDVGVGKFKSYIHKLKKKRWGRLFRRKPKSSVSAY